jgi:hypothetical protein
MMEHEEKQAFYAATRRTVTRPVRVIGQPIMDSPPRIVYRADMEAEVRGQMKMAGFEFADEPPGVGHFF